MDKTNVVIALIGTIGPLAAAGVLLVSHMWSRPKNTADAELVTAQTLTVVIDGLKEELKRVNERVDNLESELEEEKRIRMIAQELEREARRELAETEHRFQLLIQAYLALAALAAAAGVTVPPPPPALAGYLTPNTGTS